MIKCEECNEPATCNIIVEIPGLWPDKNCCNKHLRKLMDVFDLEFGGDGYKITEPHDHDEVRCGMSGK